MERDTGALLWAGPGASTRPAGPPWAGPWPEKPKNITNLPFGSGVHQKKLFYRKSVMRRDKPGPGARPATATATTTASLALFKDPGECPFINMFQHWGGRCRRTELTWSFSLQAQNHPACPERTPCRRDSRTRQRPPHSGSDECWCSWLRLLGAWSPSGPARRSRTRGSQRPRDSQSWRQVVSCHQSHPCRDLHLQSHDVHHHRRCLLCARRGFFFHQGLFHQDPKYYDWYCGILSGFKRNPSKNAFFQQNITLTTSSASRRSSNSANPKPSWDKITQVLTSCPFVVQYLDRNVPYSSIALEELLNVPVMKIRLESWMKMFPIWKFIRLGQHQA